ncbi:MAG: peptide transporter [Desulfovibrionaceae bacterium CG1_02_65_16]|nr:MAG: peptide transporter [Desulfovibrionaceae bacterium CG1_02_65_16]
MPSNVLWLSRADVESLGITMRELMDEIETGFAALGRGEVELPPKIGVHPRPDSFVHAMPAHAGGNLDVCGVKCVCGFPANSKRGLPALSGIFTLIDADNGCVRAVMDAGWLTAWRTGAASGVCARRFGAPQTKRVALIGLGVQARVNLRAMAEIFPDIEEVRTLGHAPSHGPRFEADTAALVPGARFVHCQTARDAVTDADVVISCTPLSAAPQRFIKAEWLKADSLAIAVDYDAAFEADVMAGADCFVTDDANQYLRTRETGPYFQNGYPGAGKMYADMGAICAGAKAPVRTGRRAAVLMGIALHDVLAGRLAYGKALEQRVGTWVEL